VPYPNGGATSDDEPGAARPGEHLEQAADSGSEIGMSSGRPPASSRRGADRGGGPPAPQVALLLGPGMMRRFLFFIGRSPTRAPKTVAVSLRFTCSPTSSARDPAYDRHYCQPSFEHHWSALGLASEKLRGLTAPGSGKGPPGNAGSSRSPGHRRPLAAVHMATAADYERVAAASVPRLRGVADLAGAARRRRSSASWVEELRKHKEELGRL